jgi:hypothetical protein
MTKIADLIGIKHRKYIDHTATHRHRGLAGFTHAPLYTNNELTPALGYERPKNIHYGKTS